MLSLYDEKLRKKYRLKIFLDTDEDIRLSKRGFERLLLIFNNFYSLLGCYS